MKESFDVENLFDRGGACAERTACRACQRPGPAVMDAGGHAEMCGRSKHRLHHWRPPIYAGALNMIGLNIGISAGGVFGWAVLPPTVGIPLGALAGEYVGASGDIAVGLGVGANVLVGGSGAP